MLVSLIQQFGTHASQGVGEFDLFLSINQISRSSIWLLYHTSLPLIFLNLPLYFLSQLVCSFAQGIVFQDHTKQGKVADDEYSYQDNGQDKLDSAGEIEERAVLA